MPLPLSLMLDWQGCRGGFELSKTKIGKLYTRHYVYQIRWVQSQPHRRESLESDEAEKCAVRPGGRSDQL